MWANDDEFGPNRLFLPSFFSRQSGSTKYILAATPVFVFLRLGMR